MTPPRSAATRPARFSAARRPAAEKPAASKSAAEKPAAEKPAAEKPAAERPAAEKPAARRPAARRPAAEKPAAEKPAAGRIMPATSSLSEFPDFVRSWNPHSVSRHGLDYARFETDPASRYSSLMPWQLADTAAVFAQLFPDPASVRVVIDGTAHIGVDAIHFAHLFENATVVAVEKMPPVCAKLARNIASVARRPAQLRPVCDSFLAVARRAAAGEYGAVDLVYLDPPWGGPGYRDSAAVELALDDTDIGEIAAGALKFARVVVVKAPLNFASWSLERAAATAGAVVEVFKISHSESGRPQYQLYALRRPSAP